MQNFVHKTNFFDLEITFSTILTSGTPNRPNVLQNLQQTSIFEMLQVLPMVPQDFLVRLICLVYFDLCGLQTQ